MISELNNAYESSLGMLEDGIRKISEEAWRSGTDDYLIPVRIAYHMLKGLEWLVNELPADEFKRTRRFNLDWLGPVDGMPGREAMLVEAQWTREQIQAWMGRWEQIDPSSAESCQKLEKALYLLRHTQHHIGEFSIIAHLAHCESPEWN
ncbi:MAG: hypothetical protein EHM21_19205 [Chloroflexi bacterium]|nr:MAG: hypothetical protein EHM21_19205 [Chloroflexota bacterium]